MPTTTFVWDPVNDCVISELDGTGSTQAVYTNEPQQYGGVLSQRRGSTSSFLHADALGTTRLLTSTAGATTDTYLFDAWGNPVVSTGTTVNPFKWVGRYGYYADSAAGLVYVRARMYQPTIARWCCEDPTGLKASINLFDCADNSPLFLADPSGLAPTDPYGEPNCGCGCQAESLTFSEITVQDAAFGPLRGEADPGSFLALGFQVNAGMRTVVDSIGGNAGKCRIRWFECPSVPGSAGQKALQWSEFSTPSGDPPQSVTSDWTNSAKCPEHFSRFWADRPTMPSGTGSRLQINFAVIVESSCNSTTVELLFHIDATVEKSSVIPERTKFRPHPLGIRKGLLPFKNCQRENLGDAKKIQH